MSSKSPESCNDVLFIDYVGPLLRTAKGNTAIFSVQDGYSKFVFFLAVRKQTSSIAIDCFKSFVFSQHGLCRTIFSDNGSTFMSCEFYSFNLGIKHRTISPYHPQANNVDRAHQNIVTSLRIFHNQVNNKGNVLLPYLMMAFNSVKHESLGHTPAIVYLNRELLHPLQLLWNIESDPPSHKR